MEIELLELLRWKQSSRLEICLHLKLSTVEVDKLITRLFLAKKICQQSAGGLWSLARKQDFVGKKQSYFLTFL